MFDYSQKSDIEVGATVEMNPKVHNIGMVRKTTYKFENYFPVSLETVIAILGKNLYSQIAQDVKDIVVIRDNEYKVPLGKLVSILGAKATEEIKRDLFSTPAWAFDEPNLVVMAGLTDSLDKHFKGSSYTAAWYVGLVSGTPTFAEGNTMASHAGWYEVAPFAGARPTLTLGTVVSGSVDNSAAKASYTINATMVVGGAFLVTLPTAGQTSGTLYGGAAFSGGNRSVASGDTLNVTVTLTATAA